jgi:hypothetical protein
MAGKASRSIGEIEACRKERAWTQELKSEQIRNVMDMYTTFGGYGAALIKDPVWVMNVVSSYAANTLGVVYDRGLVGTVHDW